MLEEISMEASNCLGYFCSNKRENVRSEGTNFGSGDKEVDNIGTEKWGIGWTPQELPYLWLKWKTIIHWHQGHRRKNRFEGEISVWDIEIDMTVCHPSRYGHHTVEYVSPTHRRKVLKSWADTKSPGGMYGASRSFTKLVMDNTFHNTERGNIRSSLLGCHFQYAVHKLMICPYDDLLLIPAFSR